MEGTFGLSEQDSHSVHWVMQTRWQVFGTSTGKVGANDRTALRKGREVPSGDEGSILLHRIPFIGAPSKQFASLCCALYLSLIYYATSRFLTSRPFY